MTDQYPIEVGKIAEVIIAEVEKHFPGLTKRRYDSMGYQNKEGSPAQERIEFCVYIELMKAGAFNNLLTKEEK